MDKETNEKSVKIATMVILHAGNARRLIGDAIKSSTSDNIDVAEAKLKQAKEEIQKAHSAQTEMIQEEIKGKGLELTLLLTHAQDTLMMATSELAMAKHLAALNVRLKMIESSQGLSNASE